MSMHSEPHFPGAPAQDEWFGEATSVIQFMRPLRERLDLPNVTELCVNQPGAYMLETSTGWQHLAAPELTFDVCSALATAVATLSSQHISEFNPLLSATLPTGERAQFVMPPAVTPHTVSITIRKPNLETKRLADLKRGGLFDVLRDAATDRIGLKPFEQELLQLKSNRQFAEFFELAVRSHQTIVVSGKTGSGKTTFMKALAEEVPLTERLITIEDAAELTLPNHRNTVHLFYSKGQQGSSNVSAKALLEASLRMRPDRIFLAEVRGEECFYFIRLAASGHPGSITSVHAGSCALAFDQMALMVRESVGGGGLTMPEIKQLLTAVIDIVVQFDRDTSGRRYISDVHYDPARRYKAEARIGQSTRALLEAA